MTSAEYVIKQFGGTNATATALGLHPSSVSLWKSNKPGRGHGQVPPRHWTMVLKAAEKLGLAITVTQLMQK